MVADALRKRQQNETENKEKNYSKQSYVSLMVKRESESEQSSNELFISAIRSAIETNTSSEIVRKLRLNGENISFKLDTGTRCNIIKRPQKLFQTLLNKDMVENHFGDIDGVPVAVHDDITIAGKNTEGLHDIILRQVLNSARESNIKFNRSKVQLRVREVTYLCGIVSADGFKPDQI